MFVKQCVIVDVFKTVCSLDKESFTGRRGRDFGGMKHTLPEANLQIASFASLRNTAIYVY